MLTLYPAIQPYARHKMVADTRHTLYVEECGNPEGIPALFLHGGPGAGCEEYHRRFFDPERYRIILFDQRGCGRSTPHAELATNRTQELIVDIEMIRAQLKVDQWLVFGGSWGSTLALVYAETYPQHVLALVLRGIFLCRPKEIQWFYQKGASRIYPDYWEAYLQPIPEEERANMVAAYYRRLVGENELARMAAAKAWSLWEGRTATLLPSAVVAQHFGDPHTALALARIECHYFYHDSFLEENQILHNASQLADIPGIIVHGRYDTVCPLESAWELFDAWPQAEFRIVPGAGHSALEPGITSVLIEATNHIAAQLG